MLRDPPGSRSYSWIDNQTNYHSEFKFNIGIDAAIKFAYETGSRDNLMLGVYVGSPTGDTWTGSIYSAANKTIYTKVIDMPADWATMTLKFGEEVAVFAGGQKMNFLNILPYGAVGFLSTFGLFRPDITWNFYKACQKLDMDGMRAAIRDYDMPYFDYICSLPGNFDAGIKGTLELFGFGTRLRRRPYRNLTDAEMEQLKQKLIDLKILR